MLYTGFTLDGPVAVRYPRGSGPGVPVVAAMTAIPVGRAEVRRESARRHHRIAILAFGSMLQPALAAGETLDVDLLLRLASQHSAFVTVEENVVAGGAGSAVSEALAAAGVTVPTLHLG